MARPASRHTIAPPAGTPMKKYHTNMQYVRARMTREVLRAIIRPLAFWQEVDAPAAGYSLVIAAYAPLADVLPANFSLLAGQDLTRLREVIISMDAPASPQLRKLERELAERLPVPTRVLYRSSAQAMALRAINWGWVGCWLNYVEGLAACRTRWALLHDMDAMLIDKHFLARRFARISSDGGNGQAAAKYLAVRWYEGNGIVPQDRVGYVVNMALDVASLRQRHRPIDAFNRVGTLGDRRVEWDTLLWPQQLDRATEVMPVEDGHWVHPSQVASQHMYLRRYGHYRPDRPCNLPWVPYLLDLGGQPDVLEAHRRALAESPSGRVPFLGGTIDFSGHTREQTQWTAKQMFRVEEAFHGQVRSEVRDYIDALARHERCPTNQCD